jgi:hypothetical protein
MRPFDIRQVHIVIEIVKAMKISDDFELKRIFSDLSEYPFDIMASNDHGTAGNIDFTNHPGRNIEPSSCP